jgi:hypothetical protein
LAGLAEALTRNATVTQSTVQPPVDRALDLLTTFCSKILPDTKDAEKRYKSILAETQFYRQKSTVLAAKLDHLISLSAETTTPDRVVSIADIPDSQTTGGIEDENNEGGPPSSVDGSKISWWQSLKHNVHLSTTASLSTQITNVSRDLAIARVNEHNNQQKLEQAFVMMKDKVTMMAMKKDGDLIVLLHDVLEAFQRFHLDCLNAENLEDVHSAEK